MRLTRKNEAFLGGYQPLGDYAELCSKLGPLEDIEDELGVDLTVKLRVEMAIANKVKKNKDTEVFYIGFDGSIRRGFFHKFFPTFITVLSDMEEQFFELHYKDYGKAWALTKEELE